MKSQIRKVIADADPFARLPGPEIDRLAGQISRKTIDAGALVCPLACDYEIEDVDEGTIALSIQESEHGIILKSYFWIIYKAIMVYLFIICSKVAFCSIISAVCDEMSDPWLK